MADKLKVRGIGLFAVALASFGLLLPGARGVAIVLYLLATLGFFLLARSRDVLGFWLMTIAHGLLAIGLLFGGSAMLFLWLLGLPLGMLGYVNLSNLVEWQDVF